MPLLLAAAGKHKLLISAYYRDMHDPAVAAAARSYGIRRVPVVVIDGQLADFYAASDLDEVTLTQTIFG